MWWLTGADLALPVGDIIYFGGIAILGLTSIAVAERATAIPKYKTKEKVKEKEAKKEVSNTNNRTDAFYCGALVYNNIFSITTSPMNFQTAVQWVETMAASGIYGKNSKWGLYTEKDPDAFMMAYMLGGGIPVLDLATFGKYAHYHVTGRNFRKYKHFHIWFGNLG